MLFKIETIVGAFIIAAIALFFYMSFQLGSLRLDLARYGTYTVGFKDVTGLLPKADLKIAGVKVGWIESVRLLPDDARAQCTLKILKEYNLYTNAQAIVRQEGLLGVKFLEIIPGDSSHPRIPYGGSLAYQERQFVGMDEIFYSFQKIAKQVEELGESLKGTTHQAQDLLKELKERLKPIDNFLSKLTDASQASLEQFQATAQAVKQAADMVNNTLEETRLPVKRISDLAQSIHEGKGSLGKMLTDTHLYEDIKCTSQYAKSCVERLRRCSFAVDSHLEILPSGWNASHESGRFSQIARQGAGRGEMAPWCENHRKTNVKWYANGLFFPCPNLYGLLGLVYSHQGFAKREQEWCNERRNSIVMVRRDGVRLNLQAGGWLPCGLGGRVGVFEGTAGFAVDYFLPFECMRWMTTIEAFDFKGHNRFDCDRRPHVKWLNRLFFGKSLYLSFGADDFVSRHNKSGFVGIGAYFSTCDFWK